MLVPDHCLGHTYRRRNGGGIGHRCRRPRPGSLYGRAVPRPHATGRDVRHHAASEDGAAGDLALRFHPRCGGDVR